MSLRSTSRPCLFQPIVYKCKNISIKEVGMTVPKSRETSTVLYAARQGMRASNNNDIMRNPIIKETYSGCLKRT